MGQEERKNKAKLEKTQIQLASNSNEYAAALKVLEETTGRWNREWKSACDVGVIRKSNGMQSANEGFRNSKTLKRSDWILQRAASGHMRISLLLFA